MIERRRSGGFFKTFFIALATSLTVGFLLFVVFSGYVARSVPAPLSPNPETVQNTQPPKPQQISADMAGGAPVAASVAKSAVSGVVGISVLRMDSGSIFDRNAAQKWGVGSGVILSGNGYILTNNHVAGGKSKRIVVSLQDGSNVDGTTVWADPVLDLAVVKIDAQGLTTIPIGDANALQVGEPAVAIGNPLGLQFQRTVTSGIISALNRTIKVDGDQGGPNYMEDLIQTDASINPGNSGGPLLNSKGQVVGINTIKVESAEGLGFAIPINVAVPIIRHFVDKGDFKEPYLGVFAYDREVIPYLDGNLKLDSGIYIANIDKAGPAYKSGLREGCVIQKADGNTINTMIQLRTYMYSKNPGDTISITYLKDGSVQTVNVVLAAKDKDGLVTR